MVKQLRNLAFCFALAMTSFAVSPVLSHAQSQSELDQRAYQTGYQNGVNAAQNNHPMNMNTDDWHNQRLTIYQQGYQQGYNSVRGAAAAQPGYPAAAAPMQYQDEDQRAYQTGYRNGFNAAKNNRDMNMNTDDWHGNRYTIYQQGYQAGFHAGEHERHHDGYDHH
jgi:ribosome modulation factor